MRANAGTKAPYSPALLSYAERVQASNQVGLRCTVKGHAGTATIKLTRGGGAAAAAEVGVAFASPVPGGHDGSVDGVRYFRCRPGTGLFVAPGLVEVLDDPGGGIEAVDAVLQGQARAPILPDWRVEAGCSARLPGGAVLFHRPGFEYGAGGWGSDSHAVFKRPPLSEQAGLLFDFCPISTLAKAVPQSYITLTKELGAGNFGTVHLAKVKMIKIFQEPGFGNHAVDSDGNAVFAVKTLTDDASPDARMAFLQEALVHSQFKHDNVATLFFVAGNVDVSRRNATCDDDLARFAKFEPHHRAVNPTALAKLPAEHWPEVMDMRRHVREETGGPARIILELCEDGNLNELLRAKKLTWAEIMRALADVARKTAAQ